MRTMLVPVDFSPVSRRAMKAALRLAPALGLRIELLHVVARPVFGMDLSNYGVDMMPFLHEAVRSMQKRLFRLRDRHRDCLHALPVEVGDPASLILDHARRLKAAFIVIGSHGHGAAYDLLAGSVAQSVLRHAPCPVLVLPAHWQRTHATRKRSRDRS